MEPASRGIDAGAWDGAGVRLREIGANLAVLVAFYLAGGLYLRPIWRNWLTHIAPNRGDPLFNLYILKWVGHEAARGFSGFWDAPFFYPARRVLAYSDHLVGPGLVAAAWNAAVPGWVGAYNMLLLSSFALTAWTMSWVLRRSGRSWSAALLGGAVYAFCPFRWDQLPHLQVLLMAAIPLVLWSFDQLLARPSWLRALGFLLCYALHLSGGCYLAVMIHIPLFVLACNRAAQLWRERREIGKSGFAALAMVATIAPGLLAVTFLEYWRVGAQEGLAWGTDAARHWGASLLSYLQPSDSNFYSDLWPRSLFRSENCLFPGVTATALCVAGACVLRRDRRSDYAPGQRSLAARPALRWWPVPLVLALAGWSIVELLIWSESPRVAELAGRLPHHSSRWALALVLTGLAVSAGLFRRRNGRWPWIFQRIAALAPWPRGVLLAGVATALLSTPLFFLPLSRLLPGFSSIRVPARFQAFTMFTIAFVAAAAFDALARRLRAAGGLRARRRAALFAAAVLAGAFVECAPRALHWDRLPEEEDFPEVYSWLVRQGNVHALLELPLADPFSGARELNSIQAMYFGTLHWRPLVNGFSAHFPPAYQRLEARCCYPMPDPATLAELRSLGVTHILVHRSSLRRWQRRALEEWESASSDRSDLLYAGDGDRVYGLR